MTIKSYILQFKNKFLGIKCLSTMNIKSYLMHVYCIYLQVCPHINYISLYLLKNVSIYIINLFINSMCRIPGKSCRTELSRYFIYTWEPGTQPKQRIPGESCRTELSRYFIYTWKPGIQPIKRIPGESCRTELSRYFIFT